jgi:TonB-linked SusC/RagA family outer membrane protein
MKKTVLLLLLFLIAFWGMAQEHTVTGIVIDEAQEPIVGLTVVVQGTTTGTVTDINGKYTLNVKDPGVTLVFSFVGMETQEIALEGKTTLNVSIKADATELEDIVVIGYGSQKKESVIASISTITSEDIVSSPTSNLTTGLAGKMPGLTIMIKDGELGAENVQTFIRGQATTNDAAPLILVDGVEREISSLDPYDIESVSILKDASATAVFGVRGANGVIMVTSKKGIVGKPQISANANYSLQTPTRLPRPLNAFDYMTVRNGVIDQHNQTMGQETPLPYSDYILDYYQNGYDPSMHPSWYPEYYVDRNYFDEFMYDYVPMYKGNVNIRGGNEKTKYFVSVGYMKQGGPFKTESWDEYNYDNEEKLNRFNYRANIDMQITPTLKGWLNLSGYLQDKNDPIIYGAVDAAASTGSYYYLLLASMTDTPALSFPDLNSNGDVVSVIAQDRTPYGNLNRTGYRVTTMNNINTTLGLEQKLDFITKGLSVRAITSYDANATHVRGFRRTYQTYNAQLYEDENGETQLEYIPGSGSDSELKEVLTQSFNTRFNLDASVNYARSFGSHDVTGMFLYNQYQRTVNIAVPYNYVGIVGRATYAYNKKYLAEFNFGMNGSEQFSKGNRFGFFPSVSAGWVLTEESFMQSVGAIDYFKLKATFGQVGNDRISDSRFIYVDDWTQGTGGYFTGLGTVTGLEDPVYENSMPNMLVSWEVANKYNLAFESRFFKDFEFDVDLFYEKRENILTTTSAIPVYYFGQQSLPPTNDGLMTNKGFEVTLAYNKSVNKDLFIGLRYSAAFARNTIEQMNETPLDDTYAYPYQVEGFSNGTLWGYDCLGYFESQQEINVWADQTGLNANILPGDLKYRDVNGDGTIDVKDYIPMDSPNVPELNMSFTLSAQYKGFDFSALIQGVSKYSFNFSGRGIEDWGGNAVGGIHNYFEHHKYAWTEERFANGEEIRYPRMHPDGSSASKATSNYWIIDLQYARLKNVELGYTLPKRMTSSIGLEKVRLYFNGMNLLTIDNMPEPILDPEVSNSLSHPIYATYNLGLNITF